VAGACAAAWGLRIISSSGIIIYGAGHYSFFSSYSTGKSALLSPYSPLGTVFLLTQHQACSTIAAGETCQSRIVSLEGTNSNVDIYNLNTIGSLSMIDINGVSNAKWSDNVNTFAANIAVFASG
jgi:glucan 1,3-beta-glucosidase